MRRDLNNLREQLNDTHKLNETIAYQNNKFIEAEATQLPTKTNEPHPIANLAHPSAIEVEAEEIKNEPESLNLNDIGRKLVEKALERNGGNRKKAAQELGISDRTLYRRIKQYGLDKK